MDFYFISKNRVDVFHAMYSYTLLTLLCKVELYCCCPGHPGAVPDGAVADPDPTHLVLQLGNVPPSLLPLGGRGARGRHLLAGLPAGCAGDAGTARGLRGGPGTAVETVERHCEPAARQYLYGRHASN